MAMVSQCCYRRCSEMIRPVYVHVCPSVARLSVLVRCLSMFVCMHMHARLQSCIKVGPWNPKTL